MTMSFLASPSVSQRLLASFCVFQRLFASFCVFLASFRWTKSSVIACISSLCHHRHSRFVVLFCHGSSPACSSSFSSQPRLPNSRMQFLEKLHRLLRSTNERSQRLKFTEKVSFNIASKASFIYILSSKPSIFQRLLAPFSVFKRLLASFSVFQRLLTSFSVIQRLLVLVHFGKFLKT